MCVGRPNWLAESDRRVPFQAPESIAQLVRLKFKSHTAAAQSALQAYSHRERLCSTVYMPFSESSVFAVFESERFERISTRSEAL